MPDLVDRTLFGFGEGARDVVEGGFFKEKANLVAGREEVVVSDVFAVSGAVVARACAETGQGVVIEGEIAKQLVRMGKESCAH